MPEDFQLHHYYFCKSTHRASQRKEPWKSISKEILIISVPLQRIVRILSRPIESATSFDSMRSISNIFSRSKLNSNPKSQWLKNKTNLLLGPSVRIVQISYDLQFTNMLLFSRQHSLPRDPRSRSTSSTLPSIEEGSQRDHQDPQPWYQWNCYPRRRYCPIGYSSPPSPSLRRQEHPLRLRTIQDCFGTCMWCQQSCHRSKHHHQRGIRLDGPNQKLEGQGRETPNLSPELDGTLTGATP